MLDRARGEGMVEEEGGRQWRGMSERGRGGDCGVWVNRKVTGVGGGGGGGR